MLTIVDGNNLIFRYWHGIPPSLLFRIGKKEIFNNVLQGWFNQIGRWADRVDNVDLSNTIVVFDGDGCRLREIFPDYKATRSEKPQGFKEQVVVVKHLTSWLGIKVVTSPDEADPAIAFLVKSHPESSVQIVTSDKDMMQLVTDQVTILRPESGGQFKRYGVEEVSQKMGVPPRLIPQLLALQGDKADNVPGVDGIGPKKAVALLHEYGSLTALYQDIDNLSPGIRKRLQLALPMMATYMRVVKIDPIEVAVQEPQADPEQFLRVATQLGLVNQVEKLLESGICIP